MGAVSHSAQSPENRDKIDLPPSNDPPHGQADFTDFLFREYLHGMPQSCLSEPDVNQPAKTGSEINNNTADEFGNTAAELKTAQQEISQKGITGFGFLTNLMRSNPVVAIGESHEDYDPQRLHAQEILGALAAGGANVFAAEIQDTPENRVALARFNRTGNKQDLPASPRTDSSYVQVLLTAHNLGMTIVAVDMQHVPDIAGSSDPMRDRYMRDRIMQMAQDPTKKIVFWVGERHLDNPLLTTDSCGRPTAAQLLKQGISMPTIDAVSSDTAYSPLAPLVKSLPAISSINLWDTPAVSSLNGAPGQKSDYADYFLLYPKNK
jgi:hypothetical protein